MEFDFCENYTAEDAIGQLSIGYSKTSGPLFIVIPSLSIVTNIAVMITYWRKRAQTKKNQVSMERMLFILTLFETLISFYWLFSGIFFYKAKHLHDNCTACFIFSILAIFLHSCDWIFLTFTIHNLNKIITDPIEGILRPTSRLRIYLLITYLASSAVTILSYMAKVFGRSPMLTCFIRTEFFDWTQNLTVIFFLLIPFSFICYSLFLSIKMCFNKQIYKDPNLSSLFYKYMSYISVYFLFNTPMIILYILTFSSKIEPNTFLSWLSYTSCIMCASISLVLTLVRILQGYTKIDFWNRCKKKNAKKYRAVNTNFNESFIQESGEENFKRQMTKAEEFEWLEKKILENFLRDMFVGICYFLQQSKNLSGAFAEKDRAVNEKIDKKDCLSINKNIIDENNINFEDEYVRSSGALEVNFTEYAPKVFRKLRKLEHIEENELIESLLPMKNRTSIKKSQGKSGNFFISTDDNKFILKTITPEELELIRGIFLEKYVGHLKRYPNSLICRIYGLYNMELPNGSEVLVILMRNVIGQFKKNSLCQYDLKGSSINRKTDFEIDTVHKIVMKDINFEEIEKYLLMNKVDIERLRFACMTDAYVWADMEIMDYSLFVVKISMTTKEIESIFGEKKKNKMFAEQGDFHEAINESEEIQIFKNIQEIEHYRKYLFRSLNENIVYIIAIIDFLQIYNFYKYLETNLKFYFKNRPENIEAISCVPPDIYCTRFIEYVKKITEVDENILGSSLK